MAMLVAMTALPQDSAKSILEFLEELRREREELDRLILGLERRLGISPQAATTSTDVPTGPRVKVTMEDIPVGFFHNLSQAQAAEKLLRVHPGQPLTTQEFIDVFRKSGMTLNPKNATTILYTTLTRNPKFERVAGKAWGLAEWYPENKRKPESKKPESPLESDTNVEGV